MTLHRPAWVVAHRPRASRPLTAGLDGGKARGWVILAILILTIDAIIAWAIWSIV